MATIVAVVLLVSYISIGDNAWPCPSEASCSYYRSSKIWNHGSILWVHRVYRMAYVSGSWLYAYCSERRSLSKWSAWSIPGNVENHISIWNYVIRSLDDTSPRKILSCGSANIIVINIISSGWTSPVVAILRSKKQEIQLNHQWKIIRDFFRHLNEYGKRANTC